MIKSMTGFGRGSGEEGERSFTVEMKSVNHRYLELNIRMPRGLNALEEKVRKVVSEKVRRGKIDIYVGQNVSQKQEVEAVLNEALADSYLQALNRIRDKYEVKNDISVMQIARLPEVISLEQKQADLETIWDALQKVLQTACNALISMREREGERLAQDLIERSTIIQNLVTEIEKRAPLVVIEQNQKLHNRLKELLNETQYDENRVAMEIAIFADKVSIDEELVRLKSHLHQIQETLKLEEAIGRKLDFIVQEMNRETNTIASKANDLEIINIALNIKSEIEKIREQVQNVE